MLQQIHATHWNDNVIGRLSNEECTESRKMFHWIVVVNFGENDGDDDVVDENDDKKLMADVVAAVDDDDDDDDDGDGEAVIVVPLLKSVYHGLWFPQSVVVS